MSSTQNVTGMSNLCGVFTTAEPSISTRAGAFWAPIMAYAPIPDVFDEVPYHYIPTEYACAIFVALFGLSTRAFQLGLLLHCPCIEICHDSDSPGPISILPSLVHDSDSCTRRLPRGPGLERQTVVQPKPHPPDPIFNPV
jgi:hypothetical protein